MGFSWPGEDLLRPHLQVVRGVMSSVLPQDNDPLVGTLRKLLIDSGGKMLRPTLVLLGAMARLHHEGKVLPPDIDQTGNDAFLYGSEMGPHPEKDFEFERNRTGYFPNRVYRLAAAIELLHTATLIHDDIMDGALTRRGMPTLHSRGEYKRAIMSGDYLLSAALLLTSSHTGPNLSRQAAQGIHILCKGEILQSRVQDPELLTIRPYIRQLAGKTALLFVMALRGGAQIMGNENEVELIGLSPIHQLYHRLGHWAYRIGMSFQIQDDILDFRISTKENPGVKSNFRDYEQGLYTLPIIAAIQNTYGKTPLLTFCRKNPPGKKLGKGKQKLLRKLIMNDNGFTSAESLARSYSSSAKKILETSDLNPEIKSIFSALGTALLERAT